MTDDPFQLYPTIAQIAAVFAGFGSLASGLGQRRGGDDARVDAYRLGFMLFASLSATALGLLPPTIRALSAGADTAIGISAAIGFIALVIFVPLSTRRVLKLRRVPGFSIGGAVANSACTGIALAAFALCILRAGGERIAALYLAGLMGLLGSSMVMFSRVIASMLRRHSSGDRGARQRR